MNSSREERIAEYRRGQPLDILRKRAEMARTRSRLWTQEDIDVIAVEGRKLFRDVVGCEGRMTGLLGGGIPFSVYESKITETGVTASISGQPVDEAAWLKMDDRTRSLLLSDIDLVCDHEAFELEKKKQLAAE